MKILKYYIILSLFALLVVSCIDYIDKKQPEKISYEYLLLDSITSDTLKDLAVYDIEKRFDSLGNVQGYIIYYIMKDTI